MSRFPEKIKLHMVNRLTDTHLQLVRRVRDRAYGPMDAFVQERLCQYALQRAQQRLPSQVMDFKYDNDDQDYVTMFGLRDASYSNNQLAMSHIHFVQGNGANDLKKPLTYAKAVQYLDKVFLKDDRYCNSLFVDEVKHLIFEVGSCVAATHEFGLRVIKEKRVLEVTMKALDRSSLIYFYTRDLRNIEEEQHRIAQALRGTSVELDMETRH